MSHLSNNSHQQLPPPNSDHESTNLLIRTNLVILLIALSLIVALVLSLAVGSVYLSPLELWQALWHEGEKTNQIIVWELRFPPYRVTTGLNSLFHKG